MPRKGQDRTRLTGRLTLLFKQNSALPGPRPHPRGVIANLCANCLPKAVFKLVGPDFPMVSHFIP